jgi:HK97 family phage major capsid protein
MDSDMKQIMTEIKGSVESFASRITSLQTQVDAIDSKVSEQRIRPYDGGADPIRKALEESPELNRLREIGRGKAVVQIKDLANLQVKTTITSAALGSGSAGVLMPDQRPGVIPGAQRRLFMRDVLRKSTTTNNAVFFVRENVFTNAASPQVEAAQKGQSALTFTTDSEAVICIAHVIPLTRQALDDFTTLADYVSRKLLYGLRVVEDQQILFGDGTANNLHGIYTQATAFSTSLLKASQGWNKVDILRRALQQVERADEVPAGFFVINPDDWADMELVKSTTGEYLIGDPRSPATPNLWGRPVVVTTAMSAGNFLCGSSEACEIVDRMDAIVEFSTEDGSNFQFNLVTARCESRLALLTFRPNAMIRGSLNSSPA